MTIECMIVKGLPWPILSSILLLQLGCTTLPPKKQASITEHRQECVSPIARRSAKQSISNSSDGTTKLSAALTSRFSPDALRVSEVIQALPLLARMAELTAAGKEQSTDMLIVRQLLMERILLALLEVESTTAEIVCERDRADQDADRIDEVDAQKVTNLTILSIVLSGITGIVTGGISLASGATIGADVANVGGGVLATVFGVSALFVHSQVEFQHERNILHELWEDSEQPLIFSPIVWRYLHRVEDNNDNPRTHILAVWKQKGRLGDPGTADDERRRTLFFGSGGRYSAPDLRARASLLETLEASLRLMHEELEVLILEIVRHEADIASERENHALVTNLSSGSR
jgi:hypothetical protein